MCMRTHTSLSGACVCVQESRSRADTQGETRRSWEGSGQSTWAPAGGSARAAQRDQLVNVEHKVASETPPSSSNSTLLIILHVSGDHGRQTSQAVIGKWRLVYCDGHIAHNSASGSAKPAMCRDWLPSMRGASGNTRLGRTVETH